MVTERRNQLTRTFPGRINFRSPFNLICDRCEMERVREKEVKMSSLITHFLLRYNGIQGTGKAERNVRPKRMLMFMRVHIVQRRNKHRFNYTQNISIERQTSAFSSKIEIYGTIPDADDDAFIVAISRKTAKNVLTFI